MGELRPGMSGRQLGRRANPLGSRPALCFHALTQCKESTWWLCSAKLLFQAAIRRSSALTCAECESQVGFVLQNFIFVCSHCGAELATHGAFQSLDKDFSS